MQVLYTCEDNLAIGELVTIIYHLGIPYTNGSVNNTHI